MELPIPTATGRDLLVRVKAVATNPVSIRNPPLEEAIE